jgi:hypothetical protein
MKVRNVKVKLRKLSLMLILALCLSLVPAAAFASSTVVSLNAIASAQPGGSVTISGTSTLNEVIIKVLRPGNSTVFYDIAQVTSGHFSSTFTLNVSEAAGTYKVIAGQADQVDTKDLVVETPTTPTTPSDNPGSGSTVGTITPPNPTPGTIPTPSATATAPPAATPGPITNPTTAVDQSKNVVKTETNSAGQLTTTITQDAGALADAFNKAAAQTNNTGSAPTITITANNAAGTAVTFNLPSATLANAAATTPNAVVDFKSNDGGYSLPISIIDFAAIAQSLGTTNANISIEVHISAVNAGTTAQITTSLQSTGATQLGNAIEFSVTAVGNGQSIELNNFGTTYVERTIAFAIPIDANNATVVLYDPTTGGISFVPAVFETLADGTTTVHFKRNGNSIYTVLSSTQTFSDVTKHWAKADIELLASKLIVKGVTDTSFAPNNNITRAEFASLLVRALGLTIKTEATTFKDVKSSDWFAGAVGAAVKANLVSGFEDNSFKPNDTITREQMAVMVARAITAAGKKVDSSAKPNETLAKFNDNASISSWAQDAVAQSVQANIIAGMTDKTFVPSAQASRAQAVVMLKRLLQYTSFIN